MNMYQRDFQLLFSIVKYAHPDIYRKLLEADFIREANEAMRELSGVLNKPANII